MKVNDYYSKLLFIDYVQKVSVKSNSFSTP